MILKKLWFTCILRMKLEEIAAGIMGKCKGEDRTVGVN
jgi:hypothetical protein